MSVGRRARRHAARGSSALSAPVPRLPGGRRRRMTDCIFCRIVAKQIPAAIVHEDEHALAFMDIGQVNPGHVLVATKAHAENIYDLDETQASALFRAAAKVARAVRAV